LVGIFTVHVILMASFYAGAQLSPTWYYMEYLLFVSFLLFISIKAWDQYFPERIFNISPLYLSSKTKEGDIPQKQRFETQTRQLFEKDQIFLNPDLDLAMLCKAYGISKRSLSENIQDTFNKNFNELINYYRIEYVVKCLKDGQHNQYNILSIGYSAGFASKSTFYRAFKKELGCSPSEYIEQLKKQAL
ncbi:MAG: helix-turn-helix transcriptional regulator, partial [Bacteroidota bacterium]